MKKKGPYQSNRSLTVLSSLSYVLLSIICWKCDSSSVLDGGMEKKNENLTS